MAREEVAQVERLRAEKRLGAVYLSRPRQTVFLEVFADSEEEARGTVATLPMARCFDLELFPLSQPPSAQR